MLKIFSLFVFVFSFGAFAATITVDAEFDVSVEDEEINEREIKKEGWTVKKNKYDEKVYVMKLKILDDKLPVSKSLGSSSFSITKEGLVSMGISVGDADASSNATLKLPMVNGKLFPLGQPLILNSYGGDHASGMWNFDGKLTILVTP